MKSALLLLLFVLSPSIYAVDYDAIQLYTQDELNKLIYANQHLQRVKADDCQLVKDIEARALKAVLQDYGSPVDYEQADQVLFQQIIADKKIKAQATTLLAKLADRMLGIYCHTSAQRWGLKTAVNDQP